MTKSRKLAYAALLLTAIIWGAAMPVVKPALNHISAFQYLFYRYALAAIVSLPFVIWLTIKHRPNLKTLLSIISLEFFVIVIGHFFLYSGLQQTTALEAGFIGNAGPIFIIIGGILWLKEKQEKHELIGLIFAIAAITFITLEPLLMHNQTLGGVSGWGNLMVLTYVIISTIYILLAKKIYRRTSKLFVGLLSVCIGAISFLAINLILTPDVFSTGAIVTQFMIPSVFWAAIYMGVLGSIIAVPALIYGNNLIEASEASLFSYVQPLVYIPLAVFWLKESISLPTIIALAVLALGITIAGARPRTSGKIS